MFQQTNNVLVYPIEYVQIGKKEQVMRTLGPCGYSARFEGGDQYSINGNRSRAEMGMKHLMRGNRVANRPRKTD